MLYYNFYDTAAFLPCCSTSLSDIYIYIVHGWNLNKDAKMQNLRWNLSKWKDLFFTCHV